MSDTGLDSQRLMNFLRAIEAHYPSETLAPYHNSTHACDVLQHLHLLFTAGGFSEVSIMLVSSLQGQSMLVS